MEKAIRLRFCSQAALGSQAEAGGAHGEADGLLQEAGPEKRRHLQRVDLDGSNKPATEMFGDVHVWAGCGVTKELSFLLVRLCGLCPRVLV